jgi:hypothetical protein
MTPRIKPPRAGPNESRLEVKRRFRALLAAANDLAYLAALTALHVRAHACACGMEKSQYYSSMKRRNMQTAVGGAAGKERHDRRPDEHAHLID